MNYERHYELLIERAKNRKLDCYTEKHHIIPKCMNGTDNKDNLVVLTAREHFIAHLLLLKIYPNSYGLIKALHMMCVSSKEHNSNRSMNRMYGWLKEKHSKSMSNSSKGSNNSQYGTKWIHNPETKENKKLKKSEILPDGFVYGKYKKPKEQMISKRSIKEEKNRELYSEYLIIYEEHGFERFVELTGYKFSKQNLVQRFKKLIPNFTPQNGKKRG
jgi:hypothetical protein